MSWERVRQVMAEQDRVFAELAKEGGDEMEGQQYVDGRSVAGAVSDIGGRVNKLEKAVNAETQRLTRYIEEQESWESVGRDTRHWGIWHPKYGWTWAYGIVFSTTHRAIAEAQRVVTEQIMRSKDSDLWEVRCIEEWADEQSP